MATHFRILAWRIPWTEGSDPQQQCHEVDVIIISILQRRKLWLRKVKSFALVAPLAEAELSF